MIKVVQIEESLAVGPGILEGAKVPGEVWAVLQGLEVGLGLGVFVACMGPRVRLNDPKIGHEKGRGLCYHGGSPYALMFAKSRE